MVLDLIFGSILIGALFLMYCHQSSRRTKMVSDWNRIQYQHKQLLAAIDRRLKLSKVGMHETLELTCWRLDSVMCIQEIYK